MVLKNWYNMMKAYRARRNLAGALTSWDGNVTDAGYYSQSGMERSIVLSPSDGLTFSDSIGGGMYSYIVLGSGTTPATIDDYKLENQIKSGSGLVGTIAITVDKDNDAVYKLTLTNSSVNDVTVGEIGIFASCFYTSSSYSTRCYLMERTVLDAPVTIPAGGVGIIDYAIKIPIPTA